MFCEQSGLGEDGLLAAGVDEAGGADDSEGVGIGSQSVAGCGRGTHTSSQWF